MEAEKIRSLVERLTAKTEAGELRWERGWRENTYRVSYANFTLIVEEDVTEIGALSTKRYILGILDPDGDHATSIVDDVSASKLPTHLSRCTVEREQLACLFAVAMRQVRCRAADQAVEALLERLG